MVPPSNARNGWGRNSTWPPTPERNLLPPKVCVSRKLEPEPEPGLGHLP